MRPLDTFTRDTFHLTPGLMKRLLAWRARLVEEQRIREELVR